MESLENGKEELLSGIEAEILAEKQQIINDTQKQIAEKKIYAEKRIESILNDARTQGQEKAEITKRKIISSVELEVKRLKLKARGEVIKEIINRVEKKVESRMSEEGYRQFLTDWVTEAAVGLGANSAVINASPPERQLIDEPLISQVQEKVYCCTGNRVQLQLSQSEPLKDQGVVLVSSDGRTAFNNQVKTRIRRHERTIRNLLYNNLFNDDDREN
jgi:V/A-type H+-transporting ATPase subunit E